MRCIEAPAPVKIERDKLAAMIREAEDNVTKAAKLLKRLLKLRTGISWSVTGKRGTARSWLKIDAPRARLVDSEGIPTDKSWGYMDARDRALLGVILGRLPHHQGESIRPGAGVRSSYLWRISGHAAPEDLRVAPRQWD
jgi:hypothetical protein